MKQTIKRIVRDPWSREGQYSFLRISKSVFKRSGGNPFAQLGWNSILRNLAEISENLSSEISCSPLSFIEFFSHLKYYIIFIVDTDISQIIILFNTYLESEKSSNPVWGGSLTIHHYLTTAFTYLDLLSSPLNLKGSIFMSGTSLPDI